MAQNCTLLFIEIDNALKMMRLFKKKLSSIHRDTCRLFLPLCEDMHVTVNASKKRLKRESHFCCWGESV